ncbi:jg23117 [Pararge aegeria aegeria]|uniref:Jg23117 protein n=1 Tax=Pararge aegeria aegeria TaxID=348720 RepID=A0A8S4QLP6_9NEOP|nr:jg23117 [Pararge aegeria aegeria]
MTGIQINKRNVMEKWREWTEQRTERNSNVMYNSNIYKVESTVIVPIVVSVNGLLAKNFDQHLKKLSLGCWIKGRKKIQKAVVLETARIVRRFLTLEP